MDNNTQKNDTILSIDDLFVEYRTDEGVVKALNGISLNMKKGETHGLVGETGAGKTTTGLSIMKLIADPPGIIVSGDIKLGWADENEMPTEEKAKIEARIKEAKEARERLIELKETEGENSENTEELEELEEINEADFYLTDIIKASEKDMGTIRGKRVSMIFQDPMTSLNPVMTVENQIAEVIDYHEKLGQEESMKKTRDLLELVGIPAERGKEYPHQFSGGMKQRVVIAIALACKPDLLIADEPTTALDVTIQAQVLEMMKELKVEYNTSLLMITHDLGIVADICDMVSVVYAGEIIEQGNLVDIFDNTRHPYTEGLFNSLPNMTNRTAKLKPIKGLMPNPIDLPKGCPFHPRCDYATEICSIEAPKPINRNETHFVRCHLYNEENILEGGVIERG